MITYYHLLDHNEVSKRGTSASLVPVVIVQLHTSLSPSLEPLLKGRKRQDVNKRFGA